MKKKNEAVGFKKRLAGIIFLLFSLLIVISLFNSEENIYGDFNLIINSHLDFMQIIKLDFPQMSNPVGVFGALTSYANLAFFGRFFSIILFFGFILFSIFCMIFKSNREKILKISSIIFSGLFLNVLLIEFKLSDAGIFPNFIDRFLTRIFNPIGAKFISIFLIAASLLISFEFTKIIEMFKKHNKSKKSEKDKIKKSQKDKIRGKEEITFEEEEEIVEDDEIVEVNKQKKIPIIKHNAEPKILPPKKGFVFDNNQTFDVYTKPDIESFLLVRENHNEENRKDLEKNINQIGKLLLAKLAEFDIQASIENVNVGPIITQFELDPPPGIKVSKFANLADDLGLALKAKSIRIEAPIPGRGLIGVEVPNKYWDTIYLRDVILSDEMEKLKNSPLAIALGKNISGKPVVANLAKMPHLLIAGATGAGKSVCVNTLITSILLRSDPEEVRLVLIDPKRIELSGYNGIPHLVQDVISDPEDSLASFNWAVKEMERRYSLLEEYKARDIISFNKKIAHLQKTEEDFEEKKLPYIVIVVDEFADLIMTAGRDIETPISRLAQMARAIGIHLIIATQRPSTKVITGIIKANFPTRIAFKVSSKIDSRVILDSNGAEQLLGRGDMLFLGPGKSAVERIHGAFVSDEEIESLVEYLKLQPKPEVEVKIELKEAPDLDNFNYDDELFPEAAKLVVATQTASVSMLQRHFKIGYARAGRLIDNLESARIIGEHVGSKSRDVLISQEELDGYGF